jgi:hypothetical protein
MLTLPEIVSFAAQANPHIASARRHLDEWVRHFELVQKEAAALRFSRADFAWFAGRTYPTADEGDLQLVADCFAWLFFLDDQLDDGSFGRNLAQVQTLQLKLADILLSPHRSAKAQPGLSGSPPLVRALADLWERLDGRTTAGWRSRFVGHVASGASAAEWEAANRIRQTVPDEATYIEKRRHTGAIYVCMDLIEVVERIDMPRSIYESPSFREALNAACDVVCWTNDVCSLDKEHALGEYHNLVSIVEHKRGLRREDAVEHVIHEIAAAVERFRTLEPELLRTFDAQRDSVGRYLAGMRSWMRGNVDWSLTTLRYRELGVPAEGIATGYLDTGLMAPTTPGSATQP